MNTMLQKSKSFSEETRCGFFSNPAGESLIVHDKSLPSLIEWAEYDTNERNMFLMKQDGTEQSLGIEINADMHNNLLRSKKIIFAQISENNITPSLTLPMLLRNT